MENENETSNVGDSGLEGSESPGSPFAWSVGSDGEASLESSATDTGAGGDLPLVAPLTVTGEADEAASSKFDSQGDVAQKASNRKNLWRVAVLGVVCALIGGVAGGVVARNTGNSVAIISSTAKPGAAVLPNGMPIPTLVKQVLPSVVSIDAQGQGSEAQGTGMIISSDGLVVTNNHVIENAAASGGTITVTRSGSTTSLGATLVGRDPSNDVALIKIQNGSGLPPVTLGNSNKIEVGDAAVAIGNALGLAAGTPTVTQGIISALGRTVTASSESGGGTETLNNMIQTDAAINPGNSGGPLLDSAGAVIGMNTAVAGSSTGSSAQNIGFAIPSARIVALLPELEKGGTVTKASGGYMGVQITTLTPDLRSQYNLVPTSGAVILNVTQSSPAAQAGLQQGDVIVAVNGKKVSSAEEVIAITKSHNPGDVIKVTVQRGTQTMTKSVKLTSPPS